jgi:hypothetical protein
MRNSMQMSSTSRHWPELSSIRYHEHQGLDRLFENGELLFETLEQLTLDEAAYLYKTKVLEAPLPPVPRQHSVQPKPPAPVAVINEQADFQPMDSIQSAYEATLDSKWKDD